MNEADLRSAIMGVDHIVFLFPDGHRVKGFITVQHERGQRWYVGAAEVRGATLRMGQWSHTALLDAIQKNPRVPELRV